MSNKEQILRNLEYLSGGVTALKTIFNEDERNKRFYDLFDDWIDTIYCTMDMIEEDYGECQEPLKNWRH